MLIAIRIISRINERLLKWGGVGKKPAPLDEVVNNRTKESKGSVKQQGLAID